MKNKIFIFFVIFLVVIIVLVVLPHIKIDKNNKIIYISFSDDISIYDEVTCYDDGMSYYKEKDITITDIDIEKRFIFYVISLKYEKGNLCEKEFLLEESYIEKFINNAEIISNEKNINVANLIKERKAIASNKRYSGNNYKNYIDYILDGEYQTMYVFYNNDLLIIQIGHSDEGPKFIAYK